MFLFDLNCSKVFFSAGRLPDSLRNCVNKEYFAVTPAPPLVPPVQQWAIDSPNIPHPQPSIPHLETNGTGYRFSSLPSVAAARPSSGSDIENINPHRGLPVSSIAPIAGLIPPAHSTRPSSASPVVANRSSPLPAGGKADGEVSHKE